MKNDDPSLGESAAVMFQISCHVAIANRAGHFSIASFQLFSNHKMIKDVDNKTEPFTIINR